MKSIQLVFCFAVLVFSVTTVYAADDIGMTVYTNNCAACHASGVMGAPKVGDKNAWSGLIAEGVDDLTASAIKGIGMMPPKGGNANLTDAEVKAAVAYMMETSK